MKKSTGTNLNLPWQQQTTYARYCKKCGQPLLYCSSNPDGSFNEYLDTEQKTGMHYPCYIKYMKSIVPSEEEIKQEMEKAKQEEDRKYEEAVQKYMEQIKNGHNPSPN